LSFFSRWHSAVAPPFYQYRLVELGCGDGANLLPLAFYNPESTFIGIDNSSTQLHPARKCAEHLGLQNIHFAQSDVRDADPALFAPCDYVIAHGLYSWVPDDARDAILNFCRLALSPSGLAYISYNAQPGWATRRLVRETLLRARSVREADIQDKANRAIEVAAQLLNDLPSRDYASAILLADELERVHHGKPHYVFHEYLAEVNDGFWLGDFVQRARQHGLDYVTDAQSCRWEGRVPEGLKATLANRNLDPVEQEEIADLLCHRYFRASILCRADAPRVPASRRDILEQVHVATALSALADPFDLTESTVERFRGAGGMEITLQASITKAAVVLLAARWPQGMRFEALHGNAANFLAQHGFDVAANARAQLSDDLTTLFEAGQVDFRLREPSHRYEIPDYPCAHALARFEAEHRDALTTPYHLPLPFDPPALAFARALDGSRSVLELRQAFGEELATQTLCMLGRWGLLDRY
jgi:methyltransferase-like protein